MTSGIKWTNTSVLRFAAGKNPVEAMEARVRSVVMNALDEGWKGPPFDPVDLARLLNLPIEARSDIPDARTIPRESKLIIEYNPLRPRARVRFSIAHEIAHSLFPDCAEAVRNRGGSESPPMDDWQLEMLCNIGAAELIMPPGELLEFDESSLNIARLMELRKRFDVSTEAILIRASKLSTAPCAAFCASSHDGHYKIDYIVPSRNWAPKISAGHKLPAQSVVADANAIGFTAIGNESWTSGETLHVECVALGPYPGMLVPRVVGIIRPTSKVGAAQVPYAEVTGDALDPRGSGIRLVAQVVPHSSAAWGGWGFAAQIRKKFPETWREYQRVVELIGLPLALGQGIKGRLGPDQYLFSMVAQYGVGRSTTPRIRYGALESSLSQLAEWAKELGATVHMPRIGAGHAGGDWNVIRELILDIVVKQGIGVTVYSPPRIGNIDAREGGI